MRKKIKHLKEHKPWLLGVAIFIGLGIGILIIPAINDSLYKNTRVIEPVIAPEPTEIPTTEALLDQNNWVEYRDEEFGLSFKYPKGLVQNIYNEPDQEITYYNGITFGRMKVPEGTLYNDTFEKLGYEINVKVDRTTALKEVLPEMDRYKNRPEYKKNTLTIDAIPAYRYEGVGLDWYRTIVLFERDNKLFSFTLIQFNSEKELFDEGNRIFDLIIESISFKKTM